MQQQCERVRKTYKYRLNPTPAPVLVLEMVLEMVLQRCRTLYNVALEQRTTWWQRWQDRSATYYQQKGELLDLKASCPECSLGTEHAPDRRVSIRSVARRNYANELTR
jgi:hypothetical protein